MTTAEIVSAYIRNYRMLRREEMHCFEQACLADGIRLAFCLMLDQPRHSHLTRRSRATLEEGARKLLMHTEELECASDFATLHAIVEREAGSVSDIGPLTVYDVAQRVGACLGKAPHLVYLHSGTKRGAAALGLTGKTIRRDQLPAVFARLSPAECEDCLCIYRDELGDEIGGVNAVAASSGCRRESRRTRRVGCSVAPSRSITSHGLRFWNHEVRPNPEGAVEKIRNHILNNDPHPALRADLSLRERN